MRLYFAYGSNMCASQMARRCPSARALGPGLLRGWKFIINRRGTATIIPAPTCEVHGIVWRCTRQCIATLDVHEGIAKRRYRKLFVPVQCDIAAQPVMTYAGLHRGEGRPIRSYLEGTIIPAAKSWDLPETYVSELAQWLAPYTGGPMRRNPRAKSWRP